MKQRKLWMTAAAVLLMGGTALTGCRKSNVAVAVSATDDTSQFVTLTDVVPDAILEIRYFGLRMMEPFRIR